METAANIQSEDVKKVSKPNNIIPVMTDMATTDFFKQWCIFLRPLVKLTDREMDVISSFLKQRWELSKQILDPAILDTIVMSEETKKKVIDECNITLQHFYVVMSNLRKNNVIVNNVINPRLIPNIRKDDNGVFRLMILFKDTNK